MEIFVNNKLQFVVHCCLNNSELKQHIQKELGLVSEEYYLLYNGKRIDDDSSVTDGRIYVVPRLVGGKGGFGSMLRAIGAQIEKTTNREACRDLSGRRLRDINEEQRLKNWINLQAEREKEAKEKRKKKLERLCEKPRHEFKDEEYDKERSELPDKVEDALLQGLQASCSSKRKATDKQMIVKKKKPKLWVDDELDDDLSSASDDEEGDSEGTNDHKETSKSESEDSKTSDDGKAPNVSEDTVNTEKDVSHTEDESKGEEIRKDGSL